jgi:hypothetical protein
MENPGGPRVLAKRGGALFAPSKQAYPNPSTPLPLLFRQGLARQPDNNRLERAPVVVQDAAAIVPNVTAIGS